MTTPLRISLASTNPANLSAGQKRKGISTYVHAIVDGVSYLAGALRPLDVADYFSTFAALNDNDAAVVLSQYKDYRGCYSGMWEIGCPVRSDRGNFLKTYRLAFYETDSEKGWKVEENATVVSDSYDAPKAVRVVPSESLLKAIVVRPDATRVEATLRITWTRFGVKSVEVVG